MNEDPNWVMVGFCPKNKDPGFGEFQGQVHKILPNGCAFITCQEVKDLYDQDAYVHSTVVEQCSLQVGEEICFNVHVSDAGRPQVSAPCWKRRQGLKRPRVWQAGAYGHQAGANGGKSIAKGQSGSWQRPMGEVWKAQRVDGWNGKGKGGQLEQLEQLPEDLGPASAFYIGTIKIADHAKNFSMIQCPETGLSQDVYVHCSIASPQAFALGDFVAFTFNMGAKGPQAENIFKLVGFLPPGKPPHFPENRGSISRILPNGNGFIQCPEISTAYGRDAYIHGTVVQQCGLNVGDVIAFEIHVNKDGNPQASAPCWQQVGFAGGQAAGQASGQAPSWALQAQPAVAPTPGTGMMPIGGLPKLTLSKGGTVRAGPPGQASVAPGPKGGGGGCGKGGKGAAKGSGKKGSGKNSMPAAWQTPGQIRGGDSWKAKASLNKIDEIEIDWVPDDFHVGRVSLVDLEKNVSMVRCPVSNLPRDVYVHQSVAEPSALALNDVACFKIHMNRNGLPQASAPLWKRVGVDVSDSNVRFGEFQGLVMRPSEDGPFSVDCSDVTLLHGRDATMTEETVNLSGLVEGNLICFDVSVNQNGDPEVLPPCWICCSSERWVRDLVGRDPMEEVQTMRHKSLLTMSEISKKRFEYSSPFPFS